MTRADFAAQIDELLRKVDAIPYDDYSGGIAVVDEFERLAHEHSAYLNQHITESVGSMRTDFGLMKKYKDSGKKYQRFNSVVSGLRQDVKGIRNNRYPV